MQKLIDDIKFGLRPDQFFSPVHLAETSEKLGEIGYKNTDLLPAFFDKINTLLDERILGKKEPQKLDFDQAVYGGPKNFIPRHYIFRGFENSDEFNEYLQILLEWENNHNDFAKEELAAGKRILSEEEQVKDLE